MRHYRITVLLAALGAAFALVAHAAAAATIGFGSTTIVDDQRIAGEPDIKVCGPTATWSYGNCGQNNPYGSAPYGFSTTTSFVWRSEDQGQTFKLVPSNDTTGKPDACPGGGDTDLAVSPGATQQQDFLDFIDLQALTNFSDGVSPDGGTTWACNAASSFATAVDRQWFGVYGNPAGAYGVLGGNGSIVYLDYDIAEGGATPLCGTALNTASNAFVVQKSTDGGLTYGPVTIADCNDGIAGNIEVNQTTGHVFAAHTAFGTATSPTADAVTVDRSTDSGTTWVPHTVFNCAGTCTVGQDFAVISIDKSGNLYAVWSQAPVDSSGSITGASHIFYSYSTNDGVNWSPERQVDSGGTNVNLFPWVAAGKAGGIDVVWYGTTKSAAADWDPGSQTTDWFPYLSQSLNANTSAATFSAPVHVSQHPNHNGGICTMGIGCTAGGDRSLADFFQVSIDHHGAAHVIWSDTSNNGSNNDNQGALIDSATQVSGPTVLGSTLSGAAPVCRSANSTCQADRTGDARYEANGTIGPNVPKLDITSSTVKLDPSDHSRLLVQMQLANLGPPTAADAILGGPYVDYLTSWTYHVPGNTQADYDSTGNVYYAYLEVNTVTNAVTAYDGNTCSIATTHPKYLVYPGQNAITSALHPSAKRIDLHVPRTDVGNPPTGATLYSVTAHTVSQAAAAGPFDCSTRDVNGNNQDPSGQLFNVYDKTPAYTTILG